MFDGTDDDPPDAGIGVRMELRDEEFARIVAFMSENYGIRLEKKRELIRDRLVNYLAGHGYESYGEFIDRCIEDPSGKHAVFLVDMLTTNHTYFCREPVHFEFMTKEVLPWLKRECCDSRDLRIWSAASSSGEEAYTLAMTMNDFFGSTARTWEKTILATDISRKSLKTAREGIYSGQSLKDVPPKWLEDYFDKLPDGNYEVKKKVRDSVIFRYFNLMKPFPFKKKMHVVFLRNVMIYFDKSTKAELLKKVYDAMEEGGYLFTGVTESIKEEDPGFEYVEYSIYRKPDSRRVQ